MKRIGFLIATVLCSITLLAQNQLTIDDLFYNYTYRSDYLQEVRWYGEGNDYTTLNYTEEGVELMKTNVKNGEESVMIKAAEFVPEGRERPLRIESYTWSSDYSKLLIYTNSKRVWRSNTKGDYWIFDMSSRRLFQLGKDLPASSLMFAKFSADNSKVAYVSDFNLYVESLNQQNIAQITTDGTTDIINGTFDWVYEEEFGCRDGFRWDDSGTQIAYWQIDATDIRDFYMINNTDSIYAQLIPVQYPKVGQNPSSCRIGVTNLEGKTVWMNIPGDPIQHYIPRLQWIGDKVLALQLNRKQNELKFWMCNPQDGSAEMIYSENSHAWVDIINPDLTETNSEMADMIVLDEGKAVLRLTEKDGWRHLYRINLLDGSETLITSGDYDVASYYVPDYKGKYLYINASPDNSTQRYLYRVSLDGKGTLERLTPGSYSGINFYNISPNGKYAIHSVSNANTPYKTYLVALHSHKIIRELVSNEKYIAAVEAMDLPEWKFSTITTEDGVTMDVKMLIPKDADLNKKHPVVFYVYGEPWSQTTLDNWRLGWDFLLAQQGYIVVTMDNRGTPCLKGANWRKSIYRKIGVINSRDQAMGAKEILKLPYVDDERVAVWGWSGGGSMTLNLMFRYPEIYHTGIAVAAVANQLYYDNIYQERYMGVPWENMEDFVNGSPIKHAGGLEGNLLIIHGTADDNVHYQNAEAIVNELIKLNKQFDFMPYPNASHGIYEGKNTRRHLYTLMTNYLLEHVETGSK